MLPDKLTQRWTIGIGASVLVLAVASWLGIVRVLESARWRCHPDEKPVATRIRDLGGGYRATGNERWHISSVWLNDTQATDEDIQAVLSLSHLRFLDVRGTLASDAVLGALCAHDSLRDVRVHGTDIDRQEIARRRELWHDRLYIDMESHGNQKEASSTSSPLMERTLP
jgi:hypothetical protein